MKFKILPYHETNDLPTTHSLTKIIVHLDPDVVSPQVINFYTQVYYLPSNYMNDYTTQGFDKVQCFIRADGTKYNMVDIGGEVTTQFTTDIFDIQARIKVETLVTRVHNITAMYCEVYAPVQAKIDLNARVDDEKSSYYSPGLGSLREGPLAITGILENQSFTLEFPTSNAHALLQLSRMSDFNLIIWIERIIRGDVIDTQDITITQPFPDRIYNEDGASIGNVGDVSPSSGGISGFRAFRINHMLYDSDKMTRITFILESPVPDDMNVMFATVYLTTAKQLIPNDGAEPTIDVPTQKYVIPLYRNGPSFMTIQQSQQQPLKNNYQINIRISDVMYGLKYTLLPAQQFTSQSIFIINSCRSFIKNAPTEPNEFELFTSFDQYPQKIQFHLFSPGPEVVEIHCEISINPNYFELIKTCDNSYPGGPLREWALYTYPSWLNNESIIPTTFMMPIIMHEEISEHNGQLVYNLIRSYSALSPTYLLNYPVTKYILNIGLPGFYSGYNVEFDFPEHVMIMSSSFTSAIIRTKNNNQLRLSCNTITKSKARTCILSTILSTDEQIQFINDSIDITLLRITNNKQDQVDDISFISQIDFTMVPNIVQLHVGFTNYNTIVQYDRDLDNKEYWNLCTVDESFRTPLQYIPLPLLESDRIIFLNPTNRQPPISLSFHQRPKIGTELYPTSVWRDTNAFNNGIELFHPTTFSCTIIGADFNEIIDSLNYPTSFGATVTPSSVTFISSSAYIRSGTINTPFPGYFPFFNWQLTDATAPISSFPYTNLTYRFRTTYNDDEFVYDVPVSWYLIDDKKHNTYISFNVIAPDKFTIPLFTSLKDTLYLPQKSIVSVLLVSLEKVSSPVTIHFKYHTSQLQGRVGPSIPLLEQRWLYDQSITNEIPVELKFPKNIKIEYGYFELIDNDGIVLARTNSVFALPSCYILAHAGSDINNRSNWVNACQNNGICTINGTCQCTSEFTGEFCQELIITPPIEPKCEQCVEGNYESCPTIDKPEQCICKDGFTGLTCNEAITCEMKTIKLCHSSGYNGYINGYVKPIPNTSPIKCEDTCTCYNSFVDVKCQSCSLTCFNQGTHRYDCSGCNCLAGSTGVLCECKSQSTADNGSILNGYSLIIAEYQKIKTNQTYVNELNNEYIIDITTSYNELFNEIKQQFTSTLNIAENSIQLTISHLPTLNYTKFDFGIRYNCPSYNPSIISDEEISAIWTAVAPGVKHWDVIKREFLFENGEPEFTPAPIVPTPTPSKLDDYQPPNSGIIISLNSIIIGCIVMMLF